MKSVYTTILLLILNSFVYPQGKSVAITMDDLFLAFNNINGKNLETANDSLLNSITKLKIPVTVFINEISFIQNGETDLRLQLYDKWVKNPLITIGNHTYSHKNYSEEGFTSFAEDIIKNEALTKEMLFNNKKDLRCFRFPFNCTGKDSLSRTKIFEYLKQRSYIITPFTIESADYMFNALYCDYLKKGLKNEADRIIEKYIEFTADLFKYFEGVTHELYGRNIKHIYLCHTNLLNAACFEKLTKRLKEDMGYQFVSLDEALTDNIYQSTDYYTNRYGISWIYRWIENDAKRKSFMRKEPYLSEIEEEYNKLGK